MKRTILLMILVLSLAALAGCSSGVSPTPEGVTPSLAVSNPPEGTPAQTVNVSISTDYQNALSIPLQLALGTLRLEDTPQAVTTEQAKSLVELWQAFEALSSSSSTAPEELTAVENQISEAMTAEQLRTIADLRLTNADLSAFYAEQGLTVPQPPPGITPGVSRQNLSDAQRESLRATVQASGATGLGGAGAGNGGSRQNVLVGQLVALLTKRAGS